MKISQRQSGDVTILDISGRITIGEGDVQVRDAVLENLEAGRTKLLLDMGKVSGMDSAGVGELVAAFTTARNRGGQLKLLKLSPKVSSVLQITQLHGVLEIHDDEQQAVASFG